MKTHNGKEKLPHFFLILLFFFFSGITGLTYQILWVRTIEKVIGGAPFAISIVLAVFMGGLGLGSYLASRWVDRAPSPNRLVKAYGWLEIGIGVFALIIPVLLKSMDGLYAWVYSQHQGDWLVFNSITCVFCGLVLIVPTVFMGATLPLLCRYSITSLHLVGTRTGLLYGINTFGAAAGAFLTGMIWLPKYGMTGTLWLAVAINGCIGLACLLPSLSKPARASNLPGTSKPTQKILPAQPQPMASTPNLYVFLMIVMVSGFCSMAYEVIWTKLLSLIVGPTTYSFTVVLVTFITGLAIGSVIFGRIADKVSRPEWVLLLMQIVAAISVLLCSHFLGGSQFFFAKLLFTYRDSFVMQQAMKGMALFAVMLIPTMCLGAAFPLVARLITSSTATIGRSLGIGYLVNTVGCVAGSIAAGFLIIPFVGKEKGLAIVVAVQLLSALIGIACCVSLPRRHRWSLAALVFAGLLACLVMPRWNHLHLSSSKYHRLDQFVVPILRHGWWEAALRGSRILDQVEMHTKQELLYYGEGVGGFTTVLKSPDVYGNNVISMANSGKFDASNGVDMKTQVLLAQVPMLFHPNPEFVMVVGLASGITGAEVLHYPTVKRLDILEIGDQVLAGSSFFTNENNRVIEDPRTDLILQDGRAHLTLTDRTYDVVIAEPSNPWMAGMSSLFTEEFFRTVKGRLRPGGIYVQFIHTYEIDWESFTLVTRTFEKVFPGAKMMATHPGQTGADFLLVGFADNTVGLNVGVARQKTESLRKAHNFRLTDPALFYRLIVTENLPKLSVSGPLNTDDRPILEFSSQLALYRNDASISQRLQSQREISVPTQRLVDTMRNDVDQQLSYAEFALSLQTPFADMVSLNRATDAQRQRYQALLDDYCRKYPIDSALMADDALAAAWQRQAATIESRIKPTDADARAYIADLHYHSGNKEKAFSEFNAVLAMSRENIRALNGLGILHGERKNFQEAIRCFEKALQLNPSQFEAHLNMGITYLNFGDKFRAKTSFVKALKLDSTSALARKGLELSSKP